MTLPRSCGTYILFNQNQNTIPISKCKKVMYQIIKLNKSNKETTAVVQSNLFLLLLAIRKHFVRTTERALWFSIHFLWRRRECYFIFVGYRRHLNCNNASFTSRLIHITRFYSLDFYFKRPVHILYICRYIEFRYNSKSFWTRN